MAICKAESYSRRNARQAALVPQGFGTQLSSFFSGAVFWGNLEIPAAAWAATGPPKGGGVGWGKVLQSKSCLRVPLYTSNM